MGLEKPLDIGPEDRISAACAVEEFGAGRWRILLDCFEEDRSNLVVVDGGHWLPFARRAALQINATFLRRFLSGRQESPRILLGLRIVLAEKLAVQPGTGEIPVSVCGGRRDAKGGGGLLDVQACEVTQPYQFEDGRVFAVEFF